MDRVTERIERLNALHPKYMDLSLGRIRRLLEALGNPQKNLPPTFHVGGTNGKGSTVAHLRAFLEAGGQRVHVDTSPHLVRYNERFRLAGNLVADDELLDTLDEVEKANNGLPITLFEITTALGFLLFSRHPADALLLEVGLGGRFDATNTIPKTVASIITPISFDHMDFLGDSLAKIAREKAGILKPSTPCIVARQHQEAMRVIETEAGRLDASVYRIGSQWDVREEDGQIFFEDNKGSVRLPLSALPGSHQTENAGTAIAAARVAGFDLAAEAYRRGIVQVVWPSRMQRLHEGKLAELLPTGAELWLDGGHNEAGVKTARNAVVAMHASDPRPLVVICGILKNRDPEIVLAPFAELAQMALFVPFSYPAARSPDELALAARCRGMDCEVSPSLDAAMRRIAELYDEEVAPRVLIVGSLYLAGEVLRLNGTFPT